MNLTAGTALNNGKYVLNTQMRQGVFSLTYGATNTESGQTVVIRTLAENLLQHSDFERFRQQFLERAERLKNCKHPNLVQVIDFFEDAGCPYLVMEYIPGHNLAQIIQIEIVPEAKAIDYVRQIGEALSAIHSCGLRHGDVKPQNVIRQQNTDCVMLGEFDIVSEFSAGIMQTQANLLSAGYAPLEQYAFEEQRTPATDIYGLAATLYCLLYRTPPLPAPVRQALQANGKAHLFFPDSHPVAPKIGPAVKQVIWRGLELTAQKRPQTIEAWLSPLSAPEKNPTPPTSLRECLIVQSKAGKKAPPRSKSVKRKVKAAATNGKTSPPPMAEKNQTSQPPLVQRLVAELQRLSNLNETASTRLKPPASSEGSVQGDPVELPYLPKDRKSLLKALLMTGAIAASAGVGFGFALRVNGPSGPGSTIFHTEQSFPPRSDWPGSERQL
jgi:serine/threonine-protein kinase